MRKNRGSSVLEVIGIGTGLQILSMLSSLLWEKEYRGIFYIFAFIVVSGVLLTLTFYLRSVGERIFWIVAIVGYLFVSYYNFNNPNRFYNSLVLKKRIDNLYIYTSNQKFGDLEYLILFPRKEKLPFFLPNKKTESIFYDSIKSIEKIDEKTVLITGKSTKDNMCKERKKRDINSLINSEKNEENRKVIDVETLIDIKTGKIISEKENKIN